VTLFLRLLAIRHSWSLPLIPRATSRED
jgi:hypothetical protein